MMNPDDVRSEDQNDEDIRSNEAEPNSGQDNFDCQPKEETSF